jgi:hypothetical protein
MMDVTAIKVELPSGAAKDYCGRDAWTLDKLLDAGERGVTTIDHPAPRWSHYVFRLRKSGLTIETATEKHRGDFPGTHGRYILRTPLKVIGRQAA